jgi:hypothetical protein
MGDVRRCDLLPEDLQTSAIPSDKGAHGLGRLFCTWRAPMNRPLRELCAERNRGKFGHEKYHKRLTNIADNAGGQGTVAWVAPPAGLAEIQQKRMFLQILAQSRLFLLFCQ